MTLDTPTALSRVVLHDVGSGRGGLRIDAFDGTDWHQVHETTAAPEMLGDPTGPVQVRGYSLVADVPSALGPVHAVRVLPVSGDDEEWTGFFAISGAREISLFPAATE